MFRMAREQIGSERHGRPPSAEQNRVVMRHRALHCSVIEGVALLSMNGTAALGDAAPNGPVLAERGSRPREGQCLFSGYQRFLPSITITGAEAASKSSNRRALTPIRRVILSQLPSGSKAGLSEYVAHPHSGQK